MNVHLMFRDKIFNPKQESLPEKNTLISDLELSKILSLMGGGDNAVSKSVNAAVFSPLADHEDIRYRQEILKDCINNSDTIREFYDIIYQTFERERSSWSWLSPSQPVSSVFANSINLLKIYLEMLLKLRKTADSSKINFRSQGFLNLFAVLDRELDDDYFKEAYGLLAELKSDGMLISAKFGNYNQGVGYVLRRNIEKSYFKWHLAPSYTIAPRDDSAADDLAARRERAINESANVLAQSAEHIKGFFENLRDELAFYIGCLNLYDVLKEKEIKICFPEASLPKQRNFSGLVDISLSIMIGKKAVGNRLEAYGKNFYIITGANQGGKSTFLRSIGQAQLMYQCGMFVAADYFSAPVFTGIFTHFKKEEDSRIKSGKLDEELSRMNGIADRLTSGSLVLFNESFAATNEREGAEICRQITKALSESGVEIFFVTHNYTFTEQYRKDRLQYVMFLRAGRNPDGTRTFLIEEGDPLKTAYGEDLCKGIFD